MARTGRRRKHWRGTGIGNGFVIISEQCLSCSAALPSTCCWTDWAAWQLSSEVEACIWLTHAAPGRRRLGQCVESSRPLERLEARTQMRGDDQQAMDQAGGDGRWSFRPKRPLARAGGGGGAARESIVGFKLFK